AAGGEDAFDIDVVGAVILRLAGDQVDLISAVRDGKFPSVVLIVVLEISEGVVSLVRRIGELPVERGRSRTDPAIRKPVAPVSEQLGRVGLIAGRNQRIRRLKVDVRSKCWS